MPVVGSRGAENKGFTKLMLNFAPVHHISS